MERMPQFDRWSDSIERHITAAWENGVRGLLYVDLWEEAMSWWEDGDKVIRYTAEGDERPALSLARYNVHSAVKTMRSDGCSAFWILSQVRCRMARREYRLRKAAGLE